VGACKAPCREHDMRVVEMMPLARALYRAVDIEEEIPMGPARLLQKCLHTFTRRASD
jgi:flagellar biosynthesis protein FlhB